MIIDGSIDPKSDIILQGRGRGTVIQKNSTDYAIDIQGTSDEYIENVIIRDMRITASTADTNDIPLIHFQYVKNVILEKIWLDNGPGDGILGENCENVKLDKCVIDGMEGDGVILKQTLQAAILASVITGCGGFGCKCISGEDANMIDRGNCESTGSPMITGETSPTLSDATFARSTGKTYLGSYSYKITKTVGVGTSASVALVDNISGSDLHGTTPGKTYRFFSYIYIPSGGVKYNEIDFNLVSGPYNIINVVIEPKELYDEWQKIEGVISIPLNTNYFIMYWGIDYTAAINEYFYVDEIYFYETDTENNGYIINGNTIKDNKKDGLYLATNQAQVNNNTIENNEGGGITIHGGDKNKILLNSCVDNGNLLTYVNCESTNFPHIKDDGDSSTGMTVARSSAQAYEDDYSQKLTKSSSAAGEARFCDNSSPGDMHELLAEKTYNLQTYMYLPSSGGPLAAEVELIIAYTTASTGAWNETSASPTSPYDTWQLVETENVELPASAEGTKCFVKISSAATSGESIYIDNVRLKPIGIHNEYEQNFEDNGEETLFGQNSWQGIEV